MDTNIKIPEELLGGIASQFEVEPGYTSSGVGAQVSRTPCTSVVTLTTGSMRSYPSLHGSC
jgi:hypothetical protein